MSVTAQNKVFPFSGDNTTDAAPQCTPVITEGAPGREETMSERVQGGGAVPSKRRSYFGILLASLVRANSGNAAVDATESSNSGPLFTPQTKVANTGDKKKRIAGSLTSWLPWGHSPASSATVVPVNLAEFTGAQFAE